MHYTAGCFQASLTHITSLTQKLNPVCTLKMTWNSNGCPLPCTLAMTFSTLQFSHYRAVH